MLKELGLSLEQIARLLDQETSAEEIRGMLTLRKAQIEQSLQEESTRLRVVEARLQQIETHGQMQEPDVILKAVPATPFCVFAMCYLVRMRFSVSFAALR